LFKVWTAASSQSFFDYANDTKSLSESADYVRENCHPHVYNSFIDVSRKLKAADIRGIRIREFGFHSVILAGVDTSIVDEETFGLAKEPLSRVKEFFVTSPKGTVSKAMDFSQLDEINPTSSSAAADQPAKDPKKLSSPEIAEWNNQYFPIGSVVATVYIEYESYEIADFTVADSTRLTNELVTKGVCTFHGCISGQKELEWKLTSLVIQ
jgi:hypothetical protein